MHLKETTNAQQEVLCKLGRRNSIIQPAQSLERCMYKLPFTFLLLVCIQSFAQDSLVNIIPTQNNFKSLSDSSIKINKKGNAFFEYSKKKEKFISYFQIGAYSLSSASLYYFWYKDNPSSNFHFFNDNEEYLQVDKASHVYATYTSGNMSMQMWKWAGVPKKKYVWLGGMTGLAYLTVVEIMDGFNTKWGFSIGDYTANVLGTGLLIGQELAWDEQRIQVKYSTHYQTYQPEDLERFAINVLGKDKTNRMFKDYNPQTYWLSANIKSFFKNLKVPAWLNIAVGYGADNIVGSKHINYLDANGVNTNMDYLLPRYRQWYLAPDIDLTRIKTKSKFLKTALFVLNSFKFPTPSLELSQGSLKWNWIHF